LWAAVPENEREITELDLRRCGGVGQLLADFCDRGIVTVSSGHDLPAEGLVGWLQKWFITDLGKRALVDEGRDETKGMPNAVVRALREWHLLSAELHAGSRWYALQHDCLVAPVSQARERLRRMASMLPARQSPANYLSVAEQAVSSGELALAQRHATLALRESSGRDLRLAAAAESVLGNAAYGQGDMAAAASHYRSASALYETLQDTPLVAYLLAAIGRTMLNRGQYRGAVDCLYGAVTRLPNDQAVQAGLGQALERIEMVG
jgi:tetratricopeptide (TPR) repeat protein